MAVIRSTAYGQVRKSVGANNYYRRAGVQLVRSKPTFAPGRTFTEAQLNKQFLMKAAQASMSTLGWGDVANLMNVANNKLYNSSSRFNRAVQRILSAAQTLTIDRQESPDYWATSNAGVLFENISLGDVVLDSEINDITDNTSSWIVELGGCKAAVERMIYLTNKKRARSGYLSWQNVGLVMGAKNNEPSDGVKFGVRAALAPTSYDDATGVLVYSIAAPVRSSLQLRADLFWSLFIADSVPAGAQLPAIRALHCTNTNSYEGWT